MVSRSAFDDSLAISCLLRFRIEHKPDEQDIFIQQIFEDAKLICENKNNPEKSLNILGKIRNNTYIYSTQIGREVDISWFDNIDPANLIKDDYEKLLRFYDIYQENKENNGKYRSLVNDYIWTYEGTLWVDDKDLIIIRVDHTQLNGLNPPEHTGIGITKEEFNKNYKSLKKEYI